MSLINNMLKDLENRDNKTNSSKSNAVKGLVSVKSSKNIKPAPRFAVIITVFILLLIALGWFLFKKSPLAANKETNLQISAVKKSAAPPKTETRLNNVQKSEQKPIVKSAEIALHKIDLKQTHNQITVYFNLSAPAHYEIDTETDDSNIKITLYDARIDSALTLPTIPKNPIIQNTVFEKAQNNLQINLTVLPETTVKNLEFSKDNPNQLVLVLENKTIPEEETEQKNEQTVKPVFEKITVKLTPEQEAQELYQQALTLIDTDQINNAVPLLEKSLEKMPDFVPARETLASLFIKKNEYPQAVKTLKAGLQQTPDSVALIQLYARIFVQQHQYERALSLMQQVSPPLEKNTDYYALMAYAEKNAGYPLIAAQMYERLLKFDPGQGIWWMGLGLSLEAAEQPNAAMNSYQRAVSSGDLSPSVQAYIQAKILELGGG